MDSAELELVIHGGRDLKDVKRFGTMNPYAIVWFAGCGKESIEMTTPVAVHGGSFPEWNYYMKFHIVPVKKEYSLFIQIRHDGMMFDRHIGEVEVRFADLLPPNASEGKACYQLTIPSGEEKGRIILSHKFSELFVRDDGGTGISNLIDPRGKKNCDVTHPCAEPTPYSDPTRNHAYPVQNHTDPAQIGLKWILTQTIADT